MARDPNRRALAARAAVVGTLLVPVVVAHTFEHSAFWHAVQKLAHPVVFAIVAWLLADLVATIREHSFATRRDYADAWLLAVVLGGLTELAQHGVGRDPAWSDVGRDAFGAVVGLLARGAWDARRVGDRRSRRRRALSAGALGIVACVPVIVAAAAYGTRAWRFPTLVQFSTPADLYFVARDNPYLAVVPVPSRWRRSANERALDVPLRRAAVRAFKLVEPSPDWSRFHVLLIEVTNPAEVELVLYVRVHDRAHDQSHADRFNASIRVPPRTRHVERVPLEAIEEAPRSRVLDLAAVAGIAIFDPDDSTDRRFLLHRIWLE